VNELIAQLKRSDASTDAKAEVTSASAAAAPSPIAEPIAVSAPSKPEPNSAAVTADASSDGATQLMSPRSIAAALDAAAASAMAAGIKATESSIFGTTAVNAPSKSKSAKPPKRPSTPSPAVTAEFIPGYIIKMKIGESEKAVVYLATSISLSSNVALKVSKTLRDDTAGRQFLEREYTAIIAIRDPLVVQIYDYGVHAGFEYLAMEYLLSGDLKARMQAGLKETEALRYVEQIASALRVVHGAGLLHRDLKPPNVMLRENDNVALIDFGLARALDGSTPSTRTGVLRGSPYYMSPEQALGEVLDVRSDFYSLGIMFYEMLTGRKPYTGATAMEVLQQHVNSPLPPLPHSLSRYDHFLHRLVAKNRAERFGQADEIIAAIGELRTAMTLNVESAVA
jgi:serine/threonine protein kinase